MSDRIYQTELVLTKTVETFSVILKRHLVLKPGPQGSTDGFVVFVPFEDVDAMRVLEHELAHIAFSSDMNLTTQFVTAQMNFLTRLYEYLGSHAPGGLQRFLMDYACLIEDKRVDSLWGEIYEGSAQLKLQRDRKLCSTINNPHSSILFAIAYVLLAELELPEGKFKPLEPYIQQARQKIERSSQVASLLVAKWLLSKIVDYLSFPQDTFGLTSFDKLPSRAEDFSGWSELVAPTTHDGNKPPDEKTIRTMRKRYEILAGLVEEDFHKRTWSHELFSDSYYRPSARIGIKSAAEEAAKTVYKILQFDPNDTTTLDQEIQKGRAQMAETAEQIKEALKHTGHVKDFDIRSGSLERIVIRRIRRQDTDPGRQLDVVDKDIVRRLRSTFERVRGRVVLSLHDTGTDVDVDAYIRKIVMHDNYPVFHHETQGRGFHALILADFSSSMGGSRFGQVGRAARILRQALDYPYVHVDLWGFQAHDLGVYIAQYDKDVQTIFSNKINADGRTPLHIAVRCARLHMEKMRGMRYIYVLTDGEPTFGDFYGDGQVVRKCNLFELTKNEIYTARAHGVQVVGLIIGNEVEDRRLDYMFGRPLWKRIYTDCWRASPSQDEISTNMVKIISEGFINYLQRS